MGCVFIEMSMSVDGYIAGSEDSDANPLGNGVQRLHEWMLGPSGGAPGDGLAGPDKEQFDELRSTTGAMISGRRLYEITHGWSGAHPIGGIPIFVVTHEAPDKIPGGTTPFTFVTAGIASAVAQARSAAGDKCVYVIGGASIDRQLLDAGLVDELRIDLVPVLLGRGMRLFDTTSAPIELEQAKVRPSVGVTHLWYRVLR